jgi:O-antigen ligase
LVSIVYSKFLLSVCIISLFVLALYRFFHSEKRLKGFLISYQLSGLMLIFIMVLISGLNSENLNEWAHHLKMKLPYLVLPFSLYVFKDEVVKYYHVFHQVFIVVLFISTFPVFYAIFSDYEAHLAALGVGQSADTPVDHIKYSIFLAFAGLSALIFIIKPRPVISLDVPKWFYIITVVVIFFMLHIMAVRSGLALFYTVLFITTFIFILIYKKYKWLFVLLAFIIIAPTIMYYTVPSIKAKIGYMRYDINEYLKGGGSQYSDSERWVSIQSGMQLFKENPILGTGIGDLREENSRLMKKQLHYNPIKYPHNQFVFYLAGMGIIGLVLFCFAFFHPWQLFKASEIHFIMLALLILFSFLVENTLERSYSIAFFCFYYGIGIIFSEDKLAKKPSI